MDASTTVLKTAAATRHTSLSVEDEFDHRRGRAQVEIVGAWIARRGHTIKPPKEKVRRGQMRLMASKGWAPADLRVAASLKYIGAPAKACAIKTKKEEGR